MKYYWYVTVVAVIIIAIFAFRPATLIAPGNGEVATSTGDIVSNVGVGVSSASSSVAAEKVSADVTAMAPNLDRSIVIPGSVSAEAGAIAKQKIETLSGELAKDKLVYDKWLELAIYRKMVEDYDGAREIWEYTILLQPSAFVPYNNLGDLYGFYLKDAQKSEMYFLKAIELDRKQINLYRSLFTVYHDLVKDNAKARAILQKGISANPSTSQDLKYLLDTL